MKALIIEDELRNQKMLQQMLERHCPNVIIAGYAEAVEQSIALILAEEPEVIFLDIQLKDGSGFDVLNGLTSHFPKIIFTTAYDKYAIKAFKHSAVDYLLKPLMADELVKAVEKCELQEGNSLQKIRQAIKPLMEEREDFITISGHRNIEFIKITDILRIEAQGAYSKIYLLNGTEHLISKVLKDFAIKLSLKGFVRVHQSHLVNIRFVARLDRKDQVIVLTDDTTVSLSRQLKDNFLQEMKKRSL